MFCELICILDERLASTPEYGSCFCRLIELCAKPFLKQKMSDENSYTADVLQTLTILGQLAVVSGEECITATVARSIASFHSEEPNKAFLEGQIRRDISLRGC